MIRALRGEHTILLSSHILSEISQTCDRLLVIQRGEIVAQGTEQELATQLGGGGTIEVEVVGAVGARHRGRPHRHRRRRVHASLREADGVALVSLQGAARPAAQGRARAGAERRSTCCASTAARPAWNRSSCS